MPETTLEEARTRLTQGAAHRLMGRVWTAAPLAQALLALAWPLAAWPVVGVGDRRTPAPPAAQAAEVWAVEAAFREAFQLWAAERLEA
jgi:mono/diheme cytochrome c family protein